MADSGRRYSDREVREIIKRALALQKGESSGAGADSLSLQDIENVAEGAGISPALVRRAARDVADGRGVHGLWAVLGATPRVTVNETVNERVDEDTLRELTVVLHGIVGEQGRAEVHGSSLVWSSSSESRERTGRSTTVEVIGTADETAIRVEERLGDLAAGLFGGLIGGLGLGAGLGVGFGVGIGALGSAAFAAIFPIACVAGSYMMARGLFVGIARRRKRTIGELVDKIADLIRSKTE